MKKLGYIVNPLAGIGGRVALKGSDGEEIVRKALEMGAVRMAPKRAGFALRELKEYADELEIVTYPGEMGEESAIQYGFEPIVLGQKHEGWTTAKDTKEAAKAMLDYGVDMILFAGGDGTARDIFDAVGTSIPIVGIPAGTKMHSGIYASAPDTAGKLAGMFLKGVINRTAELEVMDIDEEAFRNGVVQAKLYGFLKVPDEPKCVQGTKGGGHNTDDRIYMKGIAERIVQDMKEDVYYIIGSGTTCRAVMEELGLPNTLLGVDVVKNKQLVASDVTEQQLLGILESAEEARIVVTPIGGQGYIFGRGNQQLSGEVIKKVGVKNIIIIATPAKVQSVPEQTLKVDTGDPEVDAMLRGPKRITTSAYEIAILSVG